MKSQFRSILSALLIWAMVCNTLATSALANGPTPADKPDKSASIIDVLSMNAMKTISAFKKSFAKKDSDKSANTTTDDTTSGGSGFTMRNFVELFVRNPETVLKGTLPKEDWPEHPDHVSVGAAVPGHTPDTKMTVITPEQLKNYVMKNGAGNDTSHEMKAFTVKMNEHGDKSFKDVHVKSTMSDPGSRKKTFNLAITSANNDEMEFAVTIDPDKAGLDKYAPDQVERLIYQYQLKSLDSIQTIPFEMIPFYLGLFVNNYVNMMVRYETDPFAIDRFFKELGDPAGQMSLIAFMLGQKGGGDLLYFLHTNMSMIPLLSMAVGGIASTMSGDILRITKGCADAMHDDYDPAKTIGSFEPRAPSACRKAWDETLSSENYYNYVTSSIALVAASLLSKGAETMMAKGFAGAREAIPTLDNLAVVFEQRVLPMVVPHEGNWFGKFRKVPVYTKLASMLSPYSIGLGVANLVLFFQADALTNPIVHETVERYLHSGVDLKIDREAIAETFSKVAVAPEAFNANYCPDVQSAINKKYLFYSAIPFFNTYLNSTVADNYDVKKASLQCSTNKLFTEYADNNKKWRQVITYKFMRAYNSWMDYVNQFRSMAELTQQFYTEFVLLVSSKDAALKPYPNYFNPIFMDDPFYGVIPSETILPCSLTSTDQDKRCDYQTPNDLEKYFKDYNNKKDYNLLLKARALRVTESLAIINKHIAMLDAASKTRQTPDSHSALSDMTGPMIVGLRDGLKKAAAQISSYRDGSWDYSGLTDGIKTINALYKTYSQPRLLNQNLEIPGDIYMEYQVPRIIREVRDYIGQPMPLARVDSFMVRFNDGAKKKFPDFLNLLDKGKGSVADNLMWYAVCGKDFIRGYARTTVDMNNPSTVVNEHRKLIFGLLEWGTAWDFTPPRIVDIDTTEICKKNLPTRPALNQKSFSATKNTVSPNVDKAEDVPYPVSAFKQKSYTNLFDVAVDNLSDDLAEPNKPKMDAWWTNSIQPRLDLAWNEFEKDYATLIRNYFIPTLEGGKFVEPKSFEKMAYNNDYDRFYAGLPDSLVKSYNEQLKFYLKSLGQIHAASFADQVKSKDPLTAAAAQSEIDSMSKFSEAIQSDVSSMLNEYKTVNAIKPKDLDVTMYYARILTYMKLYIQAFNMYNFDNNADPSGGSEVADPRADKSNYSFQTYWHLNLQKDDIHYSDSAVAIFGQRLSADGTIRPLYLKMLEYQNGKQMLPIPYKSRASTNNLNSIYSMMTGGKKLWDNGQPTPFDDEKARLVYMSMSGLMNLLEDVYMNSMFIKAASGAAQTYQTLDTGNVKKGLGSTGIN